jgi:hypothetical protein
MRFVRLLLAVGGLLWAAGCAHAPQPTSTVAPKETVRRVPVEPRQTEEMSLVGGLGMVREEQVQEAVRREWGRVMACLGEEQERSPWLGGSLRMRVRIGAGGEVRSVALTESTLGRWDLERCIVGVMRTVTFPRPEGGPEAEFTYPLALRAQASFLDWPADDARVSRALARPRADARACLLPSGGESSAAPAKRSVERRKGRGEAKAKSQGASAAAQGGVSDKSLTSGSPAPAGAGFAALPSELAATVWVVDSGAVETVGLQAAEELDPKLVDCLVEKAKQWRFPDPQGHRARVTFSLVGEARSSGSSTRQEPPRPSPPQRRRAQLHPNQPHHCEGRCS